MQIPYQATPPSTGSVWPLKGKGSARSSLKPRNLWKLQQTSDEAKLQELDMLKASITHDHDGIRAQLQAASRLESVSRLQTMVRTQLSGHEPQAGLACFYWRYACVIRGLSGISWC